MVLASMAVTAETLLRMAAEVPGTATRLKGEMVDHLGAMADVRRKATYRAVRTMMPTAARGEMVS